MGTEVFWLEFVLLGVAGVVALLVLSGSPRCRACGTPATGVDEYEVSPHPHLLVVTYRCPRWGLVVARRVVGIPDE